MIAQFLRFGIVGAIGYVVDAGVLRLAITFLGLGLYQGRVLSFLCAALTTYALNRAWTFRQAAGAGRGRQILLWLTLMAGGFVINYGAYVLCLELDPMVRRYPELAVAAGAIAGMGVNFVSARWIVFRAHRARPHPGGAV